MTRCLGRRGVGGRPRHHPDRTGISRHLSAIASQAGQSPAPSRFLYRAIERLLPARLREITVEDGKVGEARAAVAPPVTELRAARAIDPDSAGTTVLDLLARGGVGQVVASWNGRVVEGEARRLVGAAVHSGAATRRADVADDCLQPRAS